MLSLKALLLVSVSCLTQLAAATPVEYSSLEVRGQQVTCNIEAPPGNPFGAPCTVSWSNPIPSTMFSFFLLFFIKRGEKNARCNYSCRLLRN
ncbi:hypothetical protein PspLS_03150 [Pyricularia sp. CBS 133598]|nr:hypothetical protein PspLS_03150 [Pyricularia sp. CBS 133598]